MYKIKKNVYNNRNRSMFSQTYIKYSDTKYFIYYFAIRVCLSNVFNNFPSPARKNGQKLKFYLVASMHSKNYLYFFMYIRASNLIFNHHMDGGASFYIVIFSYRFFFFNVNGNHWEVYYSCLNLRIDTIKIMTKTQNSRIMLFY